MRKGRIIAVEQTDAGLWMIKFDDGAVAYVEAGYGMRVLMKAAAKVGKNLVGMDIVYVTNKEQKIEGFTPVDALNDVIRNNLAAFV